MLAKGIEVAPEGSREQLRLLRDNRERLPQIREADLRYVDAIDLNLTTRGLDDAEERSCLDHWFVGYVGKIMDYVLMMELFPAPVRPTIPIFSPP